MAQAPVNKGTKNAALAANSVAYAFAKQQQVTCCTTEEEAAMKAFAANAITPTPKFKEAVKRAERFQFVRK